MLVLHGAKDEKAERTTWRVRASWDGKIHFLSMLMGRLIEYLKYQLRYFINNIGMVYISL